jgi:hypothetical protein
MMRQPLISVYVSSDYRSVFLPVCVLLSLHNFFFIYIRVHGIDLRSVILFAFANYTAAYCAGVASDSELPSSCSSSSSSGGLLRHEAATSSDTESELGSSDRPEISTPERLYENWPEKRPSSRQQQLLNGFSRHSSRSRSSYSGSNSSCSRSSSNNNSFKFSDLNPPRKSCPNPPPPPPLRQRIRFID